MQNFYQNWDGLYQAFQKPMQELIELNIKTISDFSNKQEGVDSFFVAKNPQQLMDAQIKIALNTNRKMLDYEQNLLKIFQESAEELTRKFSEKFSDMAKEGKKVADVVSSKK